MRTPIEIQMLQFLCNSNVDENDAVPSEVWQNRFGADKFGKHERWLFAKKYMDRWGKGVIATSEGRFKLLEWENLQASRRQFWVSITIAIVAVFISIGGIILDSYLDEGWQKEQIKLLQQQNELLHDIVGQGV